MEKSSNPVQEYIEELNKLTFPTKEIDFLSFLSSLNNEHQKGFLSFILSQSHIFDSMTNILETYTYKDFYFSAGYDYRNGNIVPKIDKNGKVYYEECTSSKVIDKACRKILESLQGSDKTTWENFSKYLKNIYQPDTSDIFMGRELSEFRGNINFDFLELRSDIYNNDKLKKEIEDFKNKPVIPQKGFMNKVKNFFSTRKKNLEFKKKETMIKEDDYFVKSAIELIEKYEKNKNSSNIMKRQFEFSKELIESGLDKETFLNILLGLSQTADLSSICNYKISNMLKQLETNSIIAKELYSPEILYAKTFQDMTKNIRKLLSKNELEENIPITIEYRSTPLKNALLANEDISNILKGKNLSQEEIQEKMIEYDEEFKRILEDDTPEKYISHCTDLIMKFVSTHPFDDGNGRTSRMLMQAMLARRGILLPSTIDNYFERQVGTKYSEIENNCLRTEDFSEMENYMIERAKIFNNGKLAFNDNPINFSKELNKEKEPLMR